MAKGSYQFHINVYDKDGRLHQIFLGNSLTKCTAKERKETARQKAAEEYPGYRDAELVIMHYDGSSLNDYNKSIKL